MAKFYTNYDCIGNYLYIKGYDDGEYFSEKIELNPILYVEDISGQSNIKNIKGQALNPVNLKNRNEAYNFLKQYSGTNMLVCGNTNYGNQHIIENPELIEYKQSDIKVLFHDIEVYSDCIGGKFPEPADAACPIVSVSMYDMKKDQYYLLGFPHKKGEQKWTREDSVLHTELENADEVLKKVKYFECDNELDLINKFLLTLQKLKPDVISGWNSDSFDMAYIYNRLQKLGIKPNRLSPWGKANIREFRDKFGGTSLSVNISGISNTDYLELYKKRNTIQSSYKLDYIAKKELNQNKIAYKGSLNELYENNYQKFIDYNLVDCVLLARIEEKRALFDTLFSEAYRTKSNYDDTLKTVKKWENLFADFLWKKNLIPPARRPEKYTGPKIEGGFVKEPNSGRYGWAMSFDYNSLYPNLIMQYNISPEKLVESYGKVYTTVDMLLNKETDTSFLKPEETLCASGWVYNTEKEGILPQIMRELYEERVVMKKNMIKAKQKAETGDLQAKEDAIYYDTQQQTAKLLLNSGYGALASNSFLYFDNRLAESITISGQLSIRWAEKYMNKYFNKLCKTENDDYCLAIDTDSVVGSTLIDVNGQKISIKEFFDSVKGKKVRDLENDVVKLVENDSTSLSVNIESQKIERKKINYVMEHKVKKRMFKIKCQGKEVIVTEDHSIMVMRNNEIISVKPNEIKKGLDKIIMIQKND